MKNPITGSFSTISFLCCYVPVPLGEVATLFLLSLIHTKSLVFPSAYDQGSETVCQEGNKTRGEMALRTLYCSSLSPLPTLQLPIFCLSPG